MKIIAQKFFLFETFCYIKLYNYYNTFLENENN